MGRMPRRRSKGSGSVSRLGSGSYRARWYARDGRHLSLTRPTRHEAESAMRAALVDQERLGYDRPAKTITVGKLIDVWWRAVEHSVKPRTAERYEDHLAHVRRLLGPVPLADLDYHRVELFVAELQATPLAPKTVRSCYHVFSLVLAHGQRLGLMQRAIPKPYLPKVVKPKLVIPSREQVNALAAASDKRFWAPILAAGYCGFREGELLALHRRDVHLDERYVLIHQARNKSSGAFESTKTERTRRVYLPERVQLALAEHLEEYPGEVVVPASASSLQKSWERARRVEGLDRVRFHDLRHAAASMMIAAGLNILQVSKQLGHANATQTLDIYGHLWPDSFDDAMRQMDAYLAHDAASSRSG
jgi:integrase